MGSVWSEIQPAPGPRFFPITCERQGDTWGVFYSPADGLDFSRAVEFGRDDLRLQSGLTWVARLSTANLAGVRDEAVTVGAL